MKPGYCTCLSCGACNGTGTIEVPTDSYPEWDQERCEECEGSGISERCEACEREWERIVEAADEI